MLKIMIIFIVIVLYHFPNQKATTFPRLERFIEKEETIYKRIKK